MKSTSKTILGLLLLTGLIIHPREARGQDPLPPAHDCAWRKSNCYQECFDRRIDNHEQCLELWCTRILFFRFCESEELEACLRAADEAWRVCKEACDEAYLKCLGIA